MTKEEVDKIKKEVDDYLKDAYEKSKTVQFDIE